MKIVFFKNEADFYPRLSYAWENADQIHLNSKLQGLKSLFRWVLIIPYIILWMKFLMILWKAIISVTIGAIIEKAVTMSATSNGRMCLKQQLTYLKMRLEA